MQQITRTFASNQKLVLHLVPTGPDGSPVLIEGVPTYLFDPPLDDSVLQAVVDADPTVLVLKARQRGGVGHAEVTLTATANASLVHEPERDVTAVAMLSITITPEEAVSLSFEDEVLDDTTLPADQSVAPAAAAVSVGAGDPEGGTSTVTTTTEPAS